MIQMAQARSEEIPSAIPAGKADTEASAALLPTEVTYLGGGQRYVVCAFYTPNYLPVVLHLKQSLEKFGLNYHLRCMEGRGSWEASTRLKPVFISECMEKFPDYDVLYLDADAVVKRPLDLCDTITTDVAIFFAPVVKNGKHLLSISGGTVYLRNTPGGRKFAHLWMSEEQNTHHLSVDEDMIYMAFPKFDGITFTALPRSYYKIFDANGPEPVIEHFQASRSQFKLSRFLRKGRRAMLATTGGVALVIATLLWLHII